MENKLNFKSLVFNCAFWKPLSLLENVNLFMFFFKSSICLVVRFRDLQRKGRVEMCSCLGVVANSDCHADTLVFIFSLERLIQDFFFFYFQTISIHGWLHKKNSFLSFFLWLMLIPFSSYSFLFVMLFYLFSFIFIISFLHFFPRF